MNIHKKYLFFIKLNYIKVIVVQHIEELTDFLMYYKPIKIIRVL